VQQREYRAVSDIVAIYKRANNMYANDIVNRSNPSKKGMGIVIYQKTINPILLVSIIIILLISFTGCSDNPPYYLKSGEPIQLVKGANSVKCSAQTLVDMIVPLLDQVLPITTEDTADIDAMVLLHNKLEGLGVKTGFVAINVDGNKPFLTCVAVETTDRGLMYIYIASQSSKNETDWSKPEYIQAVYLQNGRQIGFVEATYALSNDYLWYLTYLTKYYQSADYGEFVNEYGKVVDTNSARLDAIKKTNSAIRDLLDIGWPYETYSRNSIFNSRIDRYNLYIESFNAQVDDFNAEVNYSEKLNEGTSKVIFSIKEIITGPLSLTVTPKPWTPSWLTDKSFPVQPLNNAKDDLDSLLASDDFYKQLPKPDKQSCKKSARLSENNFVVDDYKVWW
jgi:hypothetical protein